MSKSTFYNTHLEFYNFRSYFIQEVLKNSFINPDFMFLRVQDKNYV